MKKLRVKDKFLEEIRKYPNVSAACAKLDFSRQTVYRWRVEDEKFKAEMDQAMQEGEESQNDMVENALMKGIKEGDPGLIKYHLDRRHPKYRGDFQITRQAGSIDYGNLKNTAESNLQLLLETGDPLTTKWFLERKGAEGYTKLTAGEIIVQKTAEKEAQEHLDKLNERVRWEDMGPHLRKKMLERKRKREEAENREIEAIDKKGSEPTPPASIL